MSSNTVDFKLAVA